jgi:hypothetical protein
MEGLNSFEQPVLDKLIAGAHPVLAVLRKQAEMARVSSREYTGAGFYCNFDVPPSAPLLPMPGNFHISDVSAVVDGLQRGAGFVLFVRDRRISFLEGYSYDEPWPKRIRAFELAYAKDPRQLEFPEGAVVVPTV